jgi:hypothetical protein
LSKNFISGQKGRKSKHIKETPRRRITVKSSLN